MRCAPVSISRSSVTSPRLCRHIGAFYGTWTNRRGASDPSEPWQFGAIDTNPSPQTGLLVFDETGLACQKRRLGSSSQTAFGGSHGASALRFAAAPNQREGTQPKRGHRCRFGNDDKVLVNQSE